MPTEMLRKISDIAEWFYSPSWQIVDRNIGEQNPSKHVLLVCRRSCKDVATIAAQLNTRARLSLLYVEENSLDFRPFRSQSEQRLASFAEVWHQFEASHTPDVIVHALGIEDDCPASQPFVFDDHMRFLDQVKEGSFYPLLRLLQAYLEQNITKPTLLACLLNDSVRVDSTDRVNPYSHMLTGFTKVVPQEQPSFSAKAIEYRSSDLRTNIDVLRSVCDELLTDADDETFVAIRPNATSAQRFERTDLNSKPAAPVELRRDGYYLITGGRGRIGQALANYLLERHGVNLVLTGIGPASEVEATNNTSDHGMDMAPGSGRKVRIESCDVGDLVATAELIRSADAEFGPIRGVIHAAGIFESQRAFRGILETSVEDCERRFLPKVNGALVLAEVLRGRDLDFCYMQSSLSALLGGFGFLAYSAGNAFMDAFGEHFRTAQQPWMSINWDGWVFRDDDAETKVRSVISPRFASPDFGVVAEIAIRPAEGAECLHRLLQWGRFEQILVSTGDLSTRYDHWISRSTLAPPNDQSLGDDSDLGKISAIFSSILGIADVQADSDYFALGGDSLSGIQLVSELSATFHCNLDIIEILEEPTPQAILKHVERRRGDGPLIDSSSRAFLIPQESSR